MSSTTISYDHGHVIIVLAPPASPRFICPSGYVCVFESFNLRGIHAQINQPLDQNIHLSQYLSPPWLSLHNKRAHATKIDNGNGSSVCYPSGAIANSISSPWNNYPFIFLSSNTNC